MSCLSDQHMTTRWTLPSHRILPAACCLLSAVCCLLSAICIASHRIALLLAHPSTFQAAKACHGSSSGPADSRHAQPKLHQACTHPFRSNLTKQHKNIIASTSNLLAQSHPTTQRRQCGSTASRSIKADSPLAHSLTCCLSQPTDTRPYLSRFSAAARPCS
jgi:hypothetical protein